MFESPTSSCVMCRSCSMVTVNWSGREAVSHSSGIWETAQELVLLTSGGNAYHDRKATMNPSQEKKNTRPYLSNWLRAGIDLALWFAGFVSGETKRSSRKLVAIIGDWKDCSSILIPLV